MQVVLAKGKDHEFILEIPFKHNYERLAALKEFKSKYYPNLCGKRPCYEFYLQFLPEDIKSRGIDYIKPVKGYDKAFYRKRYGNDGLDRYRKRVERDRFKNTLEGYVARYGEAGIEKYYIKNSKLSVSKEALARNGYTPEQILDIRKRHSVGSNSVSKNAMIRRYGIDEGTRRYTEWKECSWKSPRTTAYWVWKGYSEEEAIEMLRRHQTRNLHTFIQKYGEDDGIKRYRNWNEQKIKKIRISASSIKLFKKLYKHLRKQGFKREDIKWGIRGSSEKKLRSLTNPCSYYYDFTIEPLKIIFEYNGSHVHPNPSMSPEDWNKWTHVYDQRSADEVFKHDNRKRKTAEDHGYKVCYIWSNLSPNLKQLLQQLDENTKQDTETI